MAPFVFEFIFLSILHHLDETRQSEYRRSIGHEPEFIAIVAQLGIDELHDLRS